MQDLLACITFGSNSGSREPELTRTFRWLQSEYVEDLEGQTGNSETRITNLCLLLEAVWPAQERCARFRFQQCSGMSSTPNVRETGRERVRSCLHESGSTKSTAVSGRVRPARVQTTIDVANMTSVSIGTANEYTVVLHSPSAA